MNNIVSFLNTYLLDSDLSDDGKRYPMFEQPGPEQYVRHHLPFSEGLTVGSSLSVSSLLARCKFWVLSLRSQLKYLHAVLE